MIAATDIRALGILQRQVDPGHLTDDALRQFAADTEVPFESLQAARAMILAVQTGLAESVNQGTEKLLDATDPRRAAADFAGANPTDPSSVYRNLVDGNFLAQGASTASAVEAPRRGPANLNPEVLQTVTDALPFLRDQAYAIMDRLLEAKDPVTGLLPLHVHTDAAGKLVATDHIAAGLDMGRATAGLVMAARLAHTDGDAARAARYLGAARDNYARGKELLCDGDVFVQRRDFNPDGTVKSTEVGEPGKSAAGEDNMSRVNPRAYAIRAAAELFLSTGEAPYRADLQRFLAAWVKDFHDDEHGAFFLHANVTNPADHTERDAFKDPGGKDSAYDGKAGAKGNDGTIYALSSILLPANEALGSRQTQALVREQLDIILDRLPRKNGMVWENVTPDWRPISTGWQNQPLEDSATTSHVAIGGHTAMAVQLVLEGAAQLRRQGALTRERYSQYVERAVQLFNDFAQSGAIDWHSGRVHNAMRVEEPRVELRWIHAWGDASWQQAELLQTLLRLAEAGRLEDVRGPEGLTGVDLLRRAETLHRATNALPASYAFDGYFGNPDVYHVPQCALAHVESLG